MYEQIQQWPAPVTIDNYKKLEFDSLLNFAKTNNNDIALRLYKIISNIGIALNESNIRNLQPEITLSFEELEQQWVRFLESVRQAANNDQNQLNNANVFVDGNWSTVNINYDAGNDKFMLSDSYIFNDWNKQKDFGLLYELGKSISDVQSSARGGARSPLTKASIKAIQSQEVASKKSIGDYIESKRSEAARLMLTGVSFIKKDVMNLKRLLKVRISQEKGDIKFYGQAKRWTA
ncbi:hypothetical protein HZB74_00010 [Candidatus Saccharibacteria bacterium]|nr:hypothetical protein [Candidatus Saccharibacteria bacterium]